MSFLIKRVFLWIKVFRAKYLENLFALNYNSSMLHVDKAYKSGN